MIPELAFYSRRFLGRPSKLVLRIFPELQDNLKKADLNLPSDAYASFMVLISLIVAFAVGLNGMTLAFALTGTLPLSLAVGLAGGIMAFSFSFSFSFFYLKILASKKKRAVEESLPYALSFMGVLSTAGVPPKRIFKSLAILEREKRVCLGGEATAMYRDMELLGEDLLSVMKAEADKQISPLLSGVMEGMIFNTRSGGDLSVFFQEESKALMRMKQGLLKEFLGTLVTASEMYMSLMVAFPLILIVMLVVMSSIGGGTLGAVGPEGIVPFIIYLMLPGVGSFILFFLDAISPK